MERGKGHAFIEDEDMEDLDDTTENTTGGIGRRSYLQNATLSRSGHRCSLPQTHFYPPRHTTPSHPVYPYPPQGTGPSSSHHTTSSPLRTSSSSSQHVSLSPPGLFYTPQHSTSPSSSHHTTPSPPDHLYTSQHGIGPSSSRHTTSSPHSHHNSGHPTHYPGVVDHTSTSRSPEALTRSSPVPIPPAPIPPASIPPAIEEIQDFFRPPPALVEGEDPLIHLFLEDDMLHPSSVAAGKMTIVFKSGYLKDAWKWELVPQSQRDIYWKRWKVFFTWDLRLSFAVYAAWLKKAAIRYANNMYLIANMRRTPIYLTNEVFENYKKMRATDEKFEAKSVQMNANRKSEKGGPGTGISLHTCGSISARQHKDILKKKLHRHPTFQELFRHLHT
ncbi:hypothetical protein Sjap_020590 [Stephania japonica]|uniref:Uncharacterized protein n=1 Tax=Stephania japonica TaxID=461633 RepID=A0AAP0I0E7_9MAGN